MSYSLDNEYGQINRMLQTVNDGLSRDFFAKVVCGFSIVVLFLLLVAAKTVLASEFTDSLALIDDPIVLFQYEGDDYLGEKVRVLIDPEAELTFEDVSSPNYEAKFNFALNQVWNQGFTKNAYWLRFNVVSSSEGQLKWLLAFTNPLLDSIQIHEIHSSNKIVETDIGDRQIQSTRQSQTRLITYPIVLKKGERRYFYIRITSQSAMQMKAALWWPEKFQSSNASAELVFGGYYGMLLLIILYNVFLFFGLRDYSYLAYIGSVVAGMAFIATLNGHMQFYVLPDIPEFANRLIPLSGALWVLTTALFSKYFLEIKCYARYWVWPVNLLIFLGGAISIACFYTQYRVVATAVALAVMLSAVILLCVSVVCWKNGNHYAKFFTVAWVGYGGSAVVLAISRLSFISENILTSNSVMIGVIIETYTLSLALSEKVRLMAKGLEQHAEMLERKVAERTGELEEANLALKELSDHDQLTGIANRRRFDEYFMHEWKGHAKTHESLGVLLVDIDYFKLYNDNYGHQAGDACLQVVATHLEQAIQAEAGLVTRFGGEEFAIVVPKTSPEQMVASGERICALINALDLPHEASLAGNTVSISVGVACLTPSAYNSLNDLMTLADKALYQSKAKGRNCVSALFEESHTVTARVATKE